MGRLDEGNVVAHQDGNAVALPDAEMMQPAGDTRRAIGDLGMAAPARAAGDAEEEVGRFHFCFSDLSSVHSVIPGRCKASNPESRDSPMRNCASVVWSFGPSRNDDVDGAVEMTGISPMNKIDLDGRCAVVTGGAQGFGRAITERFAASGAKVAIWDHDQPLADKTAGEIGPAVIALKVDVSDLAAVEQARDATLHALGRIDILVNNAGIAGINKTVWETDLAEWRKVLRINLDGPFVCCKAIVPAMIAQNYGRIVNIASIAGKEGNPNAAHYSASKAGLIALTKSLGKELAQHDITVNAVTPAAAKTAIFDQLTQAHIDFMLSKIPKGRFVLVEELAAMVAWLASEDCSFSTGAVFDISGGRATY
jgi:3-oxoacyl-[acyl-carrier protein] reductase